MSARGNKVRKARARRRLKDWYIAQEEAQGLLDSLAECVVFALSGTTSRLASDLDIMALYQEYRRRMES